MDPVVILTQMMYKMKTQKEEDERRYEADQHWCEERILFEADQCCEEAWPLKVALQALWGKLARVAAIIA